MAITLQCSGCGSKFRAPDEAAGKRVKCPKCATPIQVGNIVQPPAVQGSGAAARASAAPPPRRPTVADEPPDDPLHFLRTRPGDQKQAAGQPFSDPAEPSQTLSASAPKNGGVHEKTTVRLRIPLWAWIAGGTTLFLLITALLWSFIPRQRVRSVRWQTAESLPHGNFALPGGETISPRDQGSVFLVVEAEVSGALLTVADYGDGCHLQLHPAYFKIRSPDGSTATAGGIREGTADGFAAMINLFPKAVPKWQKVTVFFVMARDAIDKGGLRLQVENEPPLILDAASRRAEPKAAEGDGGKRLAMARPPAQREDGRSGKSPARPAESRPGGEESPGSAKTAPRAAPAGAARPRASTSVSFASSTEAGNLAQASTLRFYLTSEDDAKSMEVRNTLASTRPEAWPPHVLLTRIGPTPRARDGDCKATFVGRCPANVRVQQLEVQLRLMVMRPMDISPVVRETSYYLRAREKNIPDTARRSVPVKTEDEIRVKRVTVALRDARQPIEGTIRIPGSLLDNNQGLPIEVVAKWPVDAFELEKGKAVTLVLSSPDAENPVAIVGHGRYSYIELAEQRSVTSATCEFFTPE